MRSSSLRRKTPMRRASIKPRRTGDAPRGPTIRGYTPPPTPVMVNAGTPRADGCEPIEKPLRLRSRAWLDEVKADGCEAAAPSDPCVGAVDPHHVKVRGRRGDDFDLTAIPLCRRHHDDAHDGRISREELHRMLGAYLVRKLPQLAPSKARAVLLQMLKGLPDGQ